MLYFFNFIINIRIEGKFRFAKLGETYLKKRFLKLGKQDLRSQGICLRPPTEAGELCSEHRFLGTWLTFLTHFHGSVTPVTRGPRSGSPSPLAIVHLSTASSP